VTVGARVDSSPGDVARHDYTPDPDPAASDLLMRSFSRLVGHSAVLQFAISGLLATLVIGLIAVAASRRAGTQEAIRDAKQVTRLAGEGIIEPNVGRAVLAGDEAALARLHDLVRDRVMRDGIVRVKLWSADGTIVYSDQTELIGQQFPLGAEERETLQGRSVEAEVSDLSRSENRFERSNEKLLEVYLPIHASDGTPLLFEAYQRFGSVSASGRRLWSSFAPALLGGLLLLQLVNLPLARSLARRLRRGQEEREALLHRALDASQAERRTIAADLHDGIVQDLVAVSYSLAAEARRVNGHDGGHAGLALREGAAMTRDSVRALRTLLVDIYPPNLHQAGLASALSDLATTYSGRGLTTTVDIAPGTQASEADERLLFRCAQETLRNVVKHAKAREATLSVRTDAERTVMEITDDGRGFDEALVGDRTDDGHFGLRMMGDLVADAGGKVDVRSAPGAGTTVRVELPA
jgi:two-component system, NarL family, sensor kinase